MLGILPHAIADQLMVGGAAPQPVTFVDFQSNKLIYQTRAGDKNERELERVSYITVDGEPALNEAEQAFSLNQRDKSVDGYIKTIRSTSKPWLKTFAAKRLLVAIGNANRFDARMVAYLAAVTSSTESAAALKPDLPPTGNKQLDVAVADVETALKLPNLQPTQVLALFNFLLDLHRQRRDETAVGQTLERLNKLSSTLGDLPEVKQQLASLKVHQAQTALEQKKYSEAIKIINDNRQDITDPRVQADALFILAKSRHESAAPGDQTALREAALSYMRVVAHFSDMDGKPNVLPSLQSTAAILEQIGEKKDAAAVLEQIVKDFPDDPATNQSRQDLARLKSAG